jgi:predicted GIY-YIG superfamily endonuclease
MMPDYHPDPADGLRGDRLLSEALASFETSDHAATDPGVYVLRCCSPGGTLAAHARAWRQAGYRDAHPDQMDRLASANRLVYVGAATTLRERIADHINGGRRQTAFLSVYPVFDVAGVEWTDQPFERETRVAMHLADEYPTWAVWCDGVVR